MRGFWYHLFGQHHKKHVIERYLPKKTTKTIKNKTTTGAVHLHIFLRPKKSEKTHNFGPQNSRWSNLNTLNTKKSDFGVTKTRKNTKKITTT